MFSSIIGHSENTDTLSATLEVIGQCQSQLGNMQPDAGIVFASTWYEHKIILKELNTVFPKTHFSGCSSGGEISSILGFRDDSICLILFISDSITMSAGIGLNVSNKPKKSVRHAIQTAIQDLDGKPSLCLAFPDNLHSSPTSIIDTLHQELGAECPIFGGFAAAANLSTNEVYQFHGDEVYTDAVSVLLFSGPLRTEFCISNSSKTIGGRTTIDEVDGNHVTRIGGKSALSFYRDTFGPHSEPLLEMPIAVLEENGHSYIRAAVSFDETRESVLFYGGIPQGAVVQFTEETPEGIISDTNESLSQLSLSFDSGWTPQGALIFSCGSRKWILGSKANAEAEFIHKRLPDSTPTAGFYSYGEIAPMELGQPPRYHNCTMIALLIGEQSNLGESVFETKSSDIVKPRYDKKQLTELLKRDLSRTQYYMARLERQKKLSGRMLRRLNNELVNAKRDIEKQNQILEKERQKLADMTDLLKKMFGRYLSTEVMNSLIENPSALELGGERRKVTIMMTDLRGFTALAERLEPEKVVQMLNTYFEIMVDVILKFHGTINKFIGDALLVIFGAPQEMPDRVQKSIACSIEMQNAMAEVNQENQINGLPDLEMGIGLNEAEVVVGNIGSSKRSTYSVVGSGVNMTSRIESYTVGGQILVSESVYKKTADLLRVDSQQDVFPKGADKPLRIYEIGGIAGDYNLTLERDEPELSKLSRPIPFRYTVLDGKSVGESNIGGTIIKLSKRCALVDSTHRIEELMNIKMNLADVDERLIAKHFYGKVVLRPGTKSSDQMIHFTSVPPEITAFFQAHMQHAVT